MVQPIFDIAEYRHSLYYLGMTYADSIAGNIRAEVSRREINQTDLARHLDMSQAQLSNRLRGRIEFRPSEIEKIAEFMSVDIEELTKYIRFATPKRGS